MEKLNKYLILNKAVSEINRSKINFDEIYNYLKHVLPKLRNVGYIFDEIDFLDIVYFCEANEFKYTKDRTIEVNLKYKDKKNTYTELSKELNEALKYEKKYILPLVKNKNINLYYVNFIDNYLVDLLQGQDLLNYNSNGEYIINLNNMSKKLDNSKKEVLKKIIENSKFEIKDNYRLENIIRIMNALDFITQQNYKNFHDNFSSLNICDDEFTKEYNELYEIYSIAKMNTAIIDINMINIPIDNNEKNKQKKLK